MEATLSLECSACSAEMHELRVTVWPFEVIVFSQSPARMLTCAGNQTGVANTKTINAALDFDFMALSLLQEAA